MEPNNLRVEEAFFVCFSVVSFKIPCFFAFLQFQCLEFLRVYPSVYSFQLKLDAPMDLPRLVDDNNRGGLREAAPSPGWGYGH